MNILLFILPILSFPLMYLVACLVMGKKGSEEKHLGRSLKVKKSYMHFYKLMSITLIAILFITVVRQEIIVSRLNLKDALMFLLIIGLMIKLTRNERSEKE